MTESSRREPGRPDPESAPDARKSERDETTDDHRDPSIPTLFWSFCRMIARPIMTLMFQLKAYGRHNVPRHGGCLLVSNHQSYLDPVLIGVLLPRPMAYLARSGLFKNKYFSWLISSLHAFPIRQGAGDVGAMKELIKRLKQGHLSCVFVEGSRTDTGDLMPVEPGAALVVRRAGVPVVPCVIDGSFQAWPRTQKIFHPSPISVMYGPPLKVEGLKANEITQLIERTLHEMFNELREIRRRSA
jgi:1-acyl-sn-glycerol-3-phosphate acyltransferase